MDQPSAGGDSGKSEQSGPQRSKDEVALDLMKFIAVNTGYGKSSSGAGFSGKPAVRTPEEQAESLLQLYARCRAMLTKD